MILKDEMIFVGIKKPKKPIKYFLAFDARIITYSTVPEITITVLQKSGLWKYLVEDYRTYIDEHIGRLVSPPHVDITLLFEDRIIRCHGCYVTGSSCLDIDNWPDCKYKIETKAAGFTATNTKKSKIMKKLFIKAKEEFKKECAEGF